MKIADNVYCYPEAGMLDCNTYVFKDTTTLVIDPGSRDTISGKLREMEKDGIMPEDIDVIAVTHLHPDHYWANATLKQLSGAEIVLHPKHAEHYDMMVKSAGGMFGLTDMDFNADRYLEDDKLDTGSRTFELIHAPGHSPESYCYYDREAGILSVGDVIFDHNVGRTDLPSGNGAHLKDSINRLSELPVNLLLPGHMGYVSGADAVKDNFVYVRTNIFAFI